MTSSLTNELVLRGLDCLGTAPLVTEKREYRSHDNRGLAAEANFEGVP